MPVARPAGVEPPVSAPSPSDSAALARDDAKAKAGIETPEVDRMQERVMTAISPDGRPPERKLRLAEWKWFIAGAAVLALLGLIAAALSGVAWPTLILGGALVCLFLGAAVPTWGAGLLRGGEERAARKAAVMQTKDDDVN